MDIHDTTARLVMLAQAGDKDSLNELMARTRDRIYALAHRMLRDYPVVQMFKETDDIVQDAQFQLWRALQDKQLGPVRDFGGLAGKLIRRALTNLARHYSGPAQAPNLKTANHDPEIDMPAGEPCSVEQWLDLHEAIESLPEEERTVIDLLFYQGLTQAEAAELLGVDQRTIRRRLTRARRLLAPLLLDAKFQK
jgi:RNA polymerase sigma factor (sigma-70 family)